MNEQPEKSAAQERKPDPSDSSLRSPIRPVRPDSPPDPSDSSLRPPIRPLPPKAPAPTQPSTPPVTSATPTSLPKSGLLAKGAQLATGTMPIVPTTGNQKPDDSAPTTENPKNPQAALELLRRKMEVVASEFGEGKINRAQFNAIYGRYGEQRTIIEKLIERNPENQAWKQAAAPGHTTFLRDHFEARLMYYMVYQHDVVAPLMMGGPQQPNMDQIVLVLKALWGLKTRPKIGLARKNLNNGQWLVLALGEYAVTIALFQLEPSSSQANLVRDLHGDFERANRRALERGTRSLDRFVFPQRALTEKQLSG